MKKKLFILLISTLFIFGCSNNSNSTDISEQGNSSSLESSITFSSEKESVNSEESLSEMLSSNESSLKVSEETQNTHFSIKQIKEKAKEFVGRENEVVVFESEIEVELNLKLLSCLDAITTKTGYGDRYKILMSDGEDYIYLKTNLENYEYLKKYVDNQGVYKIRGNISLYNNEVEITMSGKPVFLENENIEIIYDSFVEKRTLKEVYEDLNTLKLNCKGVAFSKLVKIEAKCLAKDINNTNLYFGNEDYIINVHGNDKITNKFTVGNSYFLIGALNINNFRPGLEYVSSSTIQNEIEFKTDNIENMSASNFYNYKYETDKENSYPEYTKLFEKPYKVTGYLNSYIKGNKEYLVLEDNYHNSYYSTYQNASNAKALFFVNENFKELTSFNTIYCPIYEHLELGNKLEVIVFPYLWNTQKYSQVYCYDFKVLS